MEEFTLYQTLNKNIPTKKLTVAQLSDLAKRLEISDPTPVAKLILTHYKREGKQINIRNPDIPYAGTTKGNETTFDLKSLPHDLQWILWKFVNIK